MSATDPAAPAVAQPPAVAEGWAVPASYAQERIWFGAQLAPDSPVYFLLDHYSVPVDLPEEGMRAVLAALCARHEPLRTSFRADPDGLMQVVHAEVPLPVEVVELSDLDGAELDERLAALLRAVAGAPMPVDRAPLWRATLAHLGPGRGWDLLIALHHAVTDAIAVEILREEVSALAAGRELPELPIQYADYAVWQRDALARGRMDELLGTWRETLAGAPDVHGVPTDRPRPAERSFAGGQVVRPLPAGSRDAAAALARRTGTTPFMVMFTAWAAVLHQLSGDEDLVIGLPVAGRDRPEVARLVGMFVNVLPIRVDLSGRPSFLELLGRVRSALLTAWDAQDMPFQRLVEELAPTRAAGLPPLYQLGFNYIDVGFSRRQVLAAEDDLTLEVSGDDFRVEYAAALFDAATAERIAGAFGATLVSGLSDPDTTIPAPRVTAAAAPVAEPAPGPEFVPPATAAEELVAEVWAGVLGRDRIGAHDDFFDLGGHSLLALRVIARLSAAAGVDLPIQDFFADTTLAGVAGALERILAAELDDMTDEEAARLVAEDSASTDTDGGTA